MERKVYAIWTNPLERDRTKREYLAKGATGRGPWRLAQMFLSHGAAISAARNRAGWRGGIKSDKLFRVLEFTIEEP